MPKKSKVLADYPSAMSGQTKAMVVLFVFGAIITFFAVAYFMKGTVMRALEKKQPKKQDQIIEIRYSNSISRLKFSDGVQCIRVASGIDCDWSKDK